MGTRPARHHDEHGFSLLESVVALALCGLLLVGVIQGLFTTVTTSTMNREQSVAATRLAAVTDRFKVLAAGSGFYRPCATPSQLQTAFEANPADTLDGATLDVTSVSLWNGSAYVSTLATCPSKDRGTQLLTVRVTVGPGADASSSTGVVVIRDPWATP